MSSDELIAYVKQLERRLAALERLEGGGVDDHGALAGLGDDDHAGYARLAGRSGGQSLIGGTAANDDLTLEGTSNATRTSSYIVMQPTAGNVGIGNSAPGDKLSVTGVISASDDVKPVGVAYGLGSRLINSGIIPSTHFASSSIPSGYSWAGSPFEGTPTYLVYNSLSDFLQVTAAAAGGRAFLYKSVTNAAANWQGKSIIGRFATGATTEIGLRIDNGTDNSYAEIFTTGVLTNGTQRVDFRHRTGGGAITTVNSAVIIPCGDFMTLQLYCYYVAPNYFIGGYLKNQLGGGINMGFTQTATSFLPAAGRAGLMCKESGNYGACDWLYNEFA